MTRKRLLTADVPTHNIKIERKKICMTDDPAEVIIDGRAYSLVMATNVLLQEGPYTDIRYYPYYSWNSAGLFRSFAGKFKWYFTLEGDKPNYSNPREIQTKFMRDIDYEHDPIDEIFVELKDRLDTARYALYEYDPKDDCKLSDEDLARYLYEGLDQKL
jgi:hypothetical protein